MRVLVDTCVWSLALRRQGPVDHPAVRAFSALLEKGEEVVIIGVILQEILQAFRADATFRKMVRHLEGFPLLPVGRDGHVAAARLHRACAASGVTAATRTVWGPWETPVRSSVTAVAASSKATGAVPRTVAPSGSRSSARARRGPTCASRPNRRTLRCSSVLPGSSVRSTSRRSAGRTSSGHSNCVHSVPSGSHMRRRSTTSPASRSS